MSDDEDNKLEDPVAEQPAKRLPPAAGMGRVKGSKNKYTKLVKDALLDSLDELGGADYFVWLAREHPPAYATLIGRIIPQQIQAELTASGSILFKTVYENGPQALPEAVQAPLIEPIEAEFVNVTLPASPSPSQSRTGEQDDPDA